MGKGKTNKRKGSDAERIYAKVFRDLGFPQCITARFGSRVHDDAGIDLINIPFNVQIKAGHQRGMNASKELGKIDELVPKYFPKNAPEHTNINILIHRKHVGRGKKRGPYDDVVHLSFEDFERLINMIQWD